MNAYYEKSELYNSNKRIIEAYLSDFTAERAHRKTVVDRLLSILNILLAVLSCESARRIFKVTSVAVCLVGFVGIIGAMEHGSINLGTGLLIGTALLGIEFFCLRKRHK